MQEAAEELEQQGMKTSDSAIIPESKELFAITTVVEKYAQKARKQCRTDTTPTLPSRQQPAQADSFRTTNSTASGSFVSKPSSYSEPVAIASPATSTEELDKTSSACGNCTGVCVCSEAELHRVILTRPSSPDSAPPPRPTKFEHPSHRFDRSWQLPETHNTAYQSTKSTCCTSDDDPSESRQTPQEPVKPDPETERIIKIPKDVLAVIEADTPEDMELSSSQGLDEIEYESDNTQDMDEASEGEAQPSIFQPVAGMLGKFPSKWQKRHERNESADDHWGKKL
jgi:hypothetical protein